MWLGIQFRNLFFAEFYALMKSAHVAMVYKRSREICLVVCSVYYYLITVKQIIQIFIAEFVLIQVLVRVLYF